jgi:ferric-chelate reductase [NAD(P)H]
MESKVIGEIDVGTHVLHIGEVVSSRVLKEGTALTYEYYQQVKKGKAPPTAPTYKAEA